MIGFTVGLAEVLLSTLPLGEGGGACNNPKKNFVAKFFVQPQNDLSVCSHINKASTEKLKQQCNAIGFVSYLCWREPVLATMLWGTGGGVKSRLNMLQYFFHLLTELAKHTIKAFDKVCFWRWVAKCHGKKKRQFQGSTIQV